MGCRNWVLYFPMLAETSETWSLTSGNERGCLRRCCWGEYFDLRDRSKGCRETIAERGAYSLQ
jgi:hypothetical protein